MANTKEEVCVKTAGTTLRASTVTSANQRILDHTTSTGTKQMFVNVSTLPSVIFKFIFILIF